MTWRTRFVLMLVLAVGLLLMGCLPEDATRDDPISPVAPPDTTDNGGDDDDDDDDDDEEPVPTGPWRSFPTNGFDVEAPSFVHLMFPVLDDTAQGITGLTLADFEILEDGAPVSTSESSLLLRRRSDIPYSLYTVLAIDNSLSLQDSLSTIKDAAHTLIDARLAMQSIAVVQFSEQATLLQDFTTDAGALHAAVDAIQPGFGGTDLYGTMISSFGLWEDVYALTGIEQGFLVLLTDGVDTAGRYTRTGVLEERGSRRVYTLGIGNEIDEDELDELGNSGFYRVAEVADLVGKLDLLQNRMEQYADAFYWITFQSPKRGNGLHNIEVRFADNANPGLSRRVYRDYESVDFYALAPGVYVNTSVDDPEGLTSRDIFSNNELPLAAVTSLAAEVPDYEWTTNNEALITITEDPVFDHQVVVTFNGGGQGTITVTDVANNMSTTVDLNVADTVPLGMMPVPMPEHWRQHAEQPR